MKFETKCIHGSGKRYDDTGAVSVPIFQTATFLHKGVGQSTGYDYSRLQNPTRESLEDTVAQLENGSAALAFATGMAAIATLMELFEPGSHIVASDDLYGGTHRLFEHVSNKNGIDVTLVDSTDIACLEAAIRPDTKAVYLETPSNPMMHVTDLRAVAQITRERGLLCIVDNTFLTPLYQRPLDLGADVVIHSGTKFLGGHNDTLAGLLVVRDTTLAERLRFLHKTTGACLAPFDSWLILRGIKTLGVRMARQQETAMQIAGYLKAHPAVDAVYYPGLKEHPGYDISCVQTTGFGSMLSFTVRDGAAARQVLERISLIGFAESLGGVETLMTYPMLQTHADIPEARRLAKGIDDRLLRLSVGLEASEDLIEDLDHALGGHE